MGIALLHFTLLYIKQPMTAAPDKPLSFHNFMALNEGYILCMKFCDGEG
jgi:hypothetical protein